MKRLQSNLSLLSISVHALLVDPEVYACQSSSNENLCARNWVVQWANYFLECRQHMTWQAIENFAMLRRRAACFPSHDSEVGCQKISADAKVAKARRERVSDNWHRAFLKCAQDRKCWSEQRWKLLQPADVTVHMYVPQSNRNWGHSNCAARSFTNSYLAVCALDISRHP